MTPAGRLEINNGITAKLDPNYDESDDENVNLRNIGDDGAPSKWSPAALVSPSRVLPTEGDDEEFNLASVELEGILADGPVAPKAAKGAISHLPVIITDEDNEEEDAGFELSS
jgi:hypothetical protein